jgi:folate-binding protein YgfZ
VEYAGPQSFFIQVAPDDVAAVRAALISSGAVACEASAVESARLEASYPLFGLDITEENLPQEADRNKRAISFTKGCYLGQETVARIDALGHVNRLLVRLKLDSDRLPANGDSVLTGEQPVGHVTSAAWSPHFNAPLAFAYVRRNYAKPGTKLTSSGSQAEVIAPPSPESA